MGLQAKQFGYTMMAFLLARIIEFFIIVFGVFVSELLRVSSMGGAHYFSLKTVFFIPVAFYIGFGYLLVSFLTFSSISLVKIGITRRRFMLVNTVPLLVWWLASAVYVFGSEIPLALLVTWMATLALNAVVGWKLIDIVPIQEQG